MIKSILTVFVMVLSSIAFVGCGSSGGTSAGGNSGQEATEAERSVEVERGKIYDANVTDGSSPVQVSVYNKTTGKYVFAKDIVLPITATGGWIDVNGDGNLTTADIKNDIIMVSYFKNVTPTTVHLGDVASGEGARKLKELIDLYGVTKEELIEIPSKGTRKSTVIANSLYQEKKNRSNTESFDINNLSTIYLSLKGLIDGNSEKTKREFAILVEDQVVNTNLVGKVVKIDANAIEVFKQTSDSFAGAEVEKKYDKYSGLSSFRGHSYGIVISPTTGKTWLDRNLGATTICADIATEQCVGDLYQWGRSAEGHQLINSQATTMAHRPATILDSNHTAVGKFILVTNDWTDSIGIDSGLTDAQAEANNAQNPDYQYVKDHLGIWRNSNEAHFGFALPNRYSDAMLHWGKTDGIKGICPGGFRVATAIEFFREKDNLAFLKLKSKRRIRITGTYGVDDSRAGQITNSTDVWTGSKSTWGSNTEGDVNAFDFDKKKLINQWTTSGLPVRCIKH